MKKCSSCSQNLPEESFAWKYYQRQRHSICKVCRKTYATTHYQNNKKKYSEKARRSDYNRRQVAKEYVATYLKDHSCVDCGISDPLVLQFDHVHGSKLFAIGSATQSSPKPLESIIAEIAKCEVRCANCHQRKHKLERLNCSHKGEPFK